MRSLLPISALVLFYGQTAFAQPEPPPAPAPPTQPTPIEPAPIPPPVPVEPAPAPTPPPVAPMPPEAPSVTPTPVEPASPPSTAADVDASALAKDGHPMAGWHNGTFYLRDYHDNFRLYVQGRAQIDTYTYFGPGVSDTGLKPTMFLRRIRPELTGEFFKDFFFSIAGDFGATGNDNTTGTNETSAAAPGAAPSATSGRYGGAQSTRVSAAATDVFLNYRAHPLFNVQVGQFDAPFTMENRTSDKFIPFMERSLAVRTVGIPTNKEIGAMFWGEDPDKLFFWSAGLFNGDGQNRLNTDSRGDVMGRVFVHPLAHDSSELKMLQVGASARYGSRDRRYSNYDYNGLTTQAGYQFWSPVYHGQDGYLHVIPSGHQTGLAGELRVPVSIVDLTSELVYINNQTRESYEGFQATNTERRGAMKGYSYYVQLGLWLMGKRDINGMPGYENPTHVDFGKADPESQPHALQLLAKWEQLSLDYESASRDGTPDAKNIDGKVKVNALSFGANYWYTKHLRFTADYVYDMFPSSSADTSPDQRARAPGNTLKAGVNDSARESAHGLHEVLFRVAVAL